MADQQFCLRWNNHQSTLISVFDTLLENGTLVDCTLAAEGQYLKAHKVVLCACSPYLETLLSQHYEKHPIVILKDVKFSELKSMMDYMYRGEVNISQDQLGTFLKAAESLQIKGLSDNGADGDARDVGSTPKAPPPRKATQPAPSSRPEPARPDSPLTDGSMSPSSRKRRRVRRSSQDDGDSHLDSNSCDLPSQAQSTPVPNIPVATSSITTTPIVKPAIVKPEQTDINRIDSNSLPPEALKKEIEPISEPLLEPKTEYLEDMNNEDSVEDLTLDDDDDMEGMDISNMSNMSNMSRPGPSHGNDVSNQGFAPWQLGANQSGTDEVFMAAQEAVNQHRDSQDKPLSSSFVDLKSTKLQITAIKSLAVKNKTKKRARSLTWKHRLFLTTMEEKRLNKKKKPAKEATKSKPTKVKCPNCDTMLYPTLLLVHEKYFCNKEPPNNLEFQILNDFNGLCLKCNRPRTYESIIFHSKYTCSNRFVRCFYCPAIFKGHISKKGCSLLRHIKNAHSKGSHEMNELVSKLGPEDIHKDENGVVYTSYQSFEVKAQVRNNTRGQGNMWKENFKSVSMKQQENILKLEEKELPEAEDVIIKQEKEEELPDNVTIKHEDTETPEHFLGAQEEKELVKESKLSKLNLNHAHPDISITGYSLKKKALIRSHYKTTLKPQTCLTTCPKCSKPIVPSLLRLHGKYFCGKPLDTNLKWKLNETLSGGPFCLKCRKPSYPHLIEFHVAYVCGKRQMYVQCFYCDQFPGNYKSLLNHMRFAHSRRHAMLDLASILPPAEDVNPLEEDDESKIVKVYFGALNKTSATFKGCHRSLGYLTDTYECFYCGDSFNYVYETLDHMQERHNMQHNTYDVLKKHIGSV